MSRSLLIAVALAAFGVGAVETASAADIPLKAARQVSPVAYRWTGCFLGGVVGYKFGTSKQLYGGERAGVPDAFLPTGFAT